MILNIYLSNVNYLFILDKKLQIEVGVEDDQKISKQKKQNIRNNDNLNPFLNSNEGGIICSKDVYSSKNPFEIELNLDQLNPFVEEDERNSYLSAVDTETSSQSGSTICKSVTDSQNSLDQEITTPNNDSFEEKCFLHLRVNRGNDIKII